ncbi:signal transduction histidine kinase LytS [Myxococcus stipitatus DSM 14675]|uniref:histidine kinase n=1 Tax=Myxococcus stipitatus (strain DSM 14675 / JCM 12634 / Mx s8) TaxID=1278073 RepID=L7UG18_MYXSD|nr:histidine kinase [Myxococcus stipitatus]AGC46943.1 signal transduction histidine kinase LytS [Myxococcus stipitatus DSM 14675]
MSPVEQTPSSPWRRVLKWVAVWSAPGMFSAVETYFFSLSAQRPMPFWRAVVTQLPAWYVWVPVTPLVLLLVRRWPLGRPFQAKAWAGHGVTCLGVGGLFALAYSLCQDAFSSGLAAAGALSFSSMVLRYILGWMPMVAMTYAAVVAVAQSLASQERAREKERQAAALAVELAEARLLALQVQLHPHFLFNTLNAIVVLVRANETDTAARMLVLLSDILRRLLQQGATQEVSLRDEVAVLSRYLEIQQLRFQDRLRVTWEVDDALLDARVPNLVLQPLVENAIRHGVSARSAAGRLRIGARRRGDVLELVVEDDGPGLPEGFDLERSPGIGLSNTRARLSQLYGEAGRVSVGAPSQGVGTVATVLLPLLPFPVSGGARG